MNEKFDNIIAEVELFLEKGDVEAAKLGLMMVAQNVAENRLKDALKVLELLVRIQIRQGVYWGEPEQNYAKVILDTAENAGLYDCAYFEFKVAMTHALAQVKKPILGDEPAQSEDDLAEILALKDEYLDYAIEYFESNQHLFDEFMATHLLFLLIYRAEELQGVPHQASVINFSSLMTRAKQISVKIDIIAEEGFSVQPFSDFGQDYVLSDDLEEYSQTRVFDAIEHEAEDMGQQAFYSKLNFLVVLAQVDFQEATKVVAEELLNEYSLIQNGSDYSSLVQKLALGKHGYEQAKALGLLADFPLV